MSRFLQTSERMDLGIAVAHALHKGEVLTTEAIAAFTDCDAQTIRN